MKRFVGLLFLLSCAPALAQGINPVAPATNSMIQIQQPAFIDPSSLYTTPVLLFSGGTKPTLTGSCAVVAGTRVGGALAGSFVIPAGDCAASTTVILSMPTATNGWACDGHNLNTPTSVVNQTATAVASITFTITTVTSVAGDVVTWKCMGY